MKKNQIEKHLKSAIRDMTPDIFNQISSLEVSEERESVIMNNKKAKVTKYISGFAACAAAIALFAGVTVYGNNYKVSSLISIDVNPSIEISTNKKDKVLKVVPLNKDGEIILDGMDLEHIDLNIAVNSIMGSMVKNGFITDVKNSVLISVKNDNKEKSNELELALIDDIRATLKDNNVNPSIYNQNLSKIDKEIEGLAKEYGISYGKMVFIKNIIDKDSSLSIEQLSKLTLEEISDLIKERKIDIYDIVDYNPDESIEEPNDTLDDDDIDDEKDKDNNKNGEKDNDNNKNGEKDNDNNKNGEKDNDNNKNGEKDNDNNKNGEKDNDNNKNGEKDNDNNKNGEKDNDNNKNGEKDNDNNKNGEKDNDNNKYKDKDDIDDKNDTDDEDDVDDKNNDNNKLKDKVTGKDKNNDKIKSKEKDKDKDDDDED